MGGWWIVAMLAGPAWGADGGTPFTLLEGVEVGRSAPLRDLALRVHGYSLDGGRLLAVDAEGAALVDERGVVRARFACPGAEGAAPTDLSLSGDNAVAIARYDGGHTCAWGGDGTLFGSPARGAAAVAAGGSRVVAVGYADGRVEGRDPRTGRRKWTRNPELGGVLHLRWEAKGPRVAASTGPGGVAVLDSRSGRLVRALRGRPAFSAAFDRTGRTIAVGRGGGRVELWDTGQWYEKSSVRFTAGDVVDVDFSPTGDLLAAAIARTRDGTREIVLEVWDFALEEPVFREVLPAGDGAVRFRFDALGERVVASGGGATSRMWPRPGTRVIPRPPPNDEPPHQRPFKDLPELPPLVLVAPTHRVPGALLASADGRRVLARVEAVGASASGGGGGAPRNAPPAAAGALPAASPAPAPGLAITDLGTGATVALAESAAAAGPFALSPDGARVAAYVGDRLVVWDAATGARLARINVGRPASVALLGERIAVATTDGKAYAGTVERMRVVPNVGDTTAVAIDPFHADRVGIGTRDGGVRVVEARTGASLGAWAVHAGAPTALVFSADGRRLASAGPRPGASGGRLVVLGTERADEAAEPWSAVLDAVPERLSFDAAAERVVARGPGLATVVARGGVALDLSANLVDAALVGAELRWVDTLGNVRGAAVGEARPAVPRGAFFARSDDFRFAVTVDGDRLAVWDDKKGRLLRELPPTGQAVAGCVFDDAGGRLAVRYADGSVEIYEVATGEVLRNVPGAPDGADPWMRFSDDGALLWTFSDARTVTAWDVAAGGARETVTLPGPARLDGASARLRFVRFVGEAGEAWIDTAAVSPRRLTVAADGFGPRAALPQERQLVAVQDGALVRVDADAGRRVGPELRVEGDAPSGPVAVSPDGRWVVAAYTSGLLRVWEVERAAIAAVLGADARAPFAGPVRPVASLAFDAAGDVVTARDATGFPRLFDWRLSIEAGVVGLGAGPVLVSAEIVALAVSPDGAALYSAHRDGNARSWDLATGVQTNFYGGHAGPLTDLAVAGDGRRLVTASEDGTVRAWDTIVAAQRLALAAFGDPVRELAVSADGWLVAAAGDGAVLRTWDGGGGKGLKRWAFGGGPLDALAVGPVRGAVYATRADATWALDATTGAVALAAPGPLPGAPPPVEAPEIAELRAMAAALAPVTAEARTPDGRTFVTAGADGRIRLWDRETLALRATLRALTDGSWIVDRADGSRYASESLRDGTSPLLYRPPPR